MQTVSTTRGSKPLVVGAATGVGRGAFLCDSMYRATSSPETRPPGPVASISVIVAGSSPASWASLEARGVHRTVEVAAEAATGAAGGGTGLVWEIVTAGMALASAG